MMIEFVGSQLSFVAPGGGRRRVQRGDTLVVGEDIPEDVFAAYAHKFRIIGDVVVVPAARVVTPKGITHTGSGWYAVEGVSGKYRRADAERLAFGSDDD